MKSITPREPLSRCFRQSCEFWRWRCATCSPPCLPGEAAACHCSLCNLPRNVPLRLRAHFPVTLCQRARKAIVERVAAPSSSASPSRLALNSLSLQTHKTRWHRRRSLECRRVYIGPGPPRSDPGAVFTCVLRQPMCLPDGVFLAPAEYHRTLMCNQARVQGRVQAASSADNQRVGKRKM